MDPLNSHDIQIPCALSFPFLFSVSPEGSLNCFLSNCFSLSEGLYSLLKSPDSWWLVLVFDACLPCEPSYCSHAKYNERQWGPKLQLEHSSKYLCFHKRKSCKFGRHEGGYKIREIKILNYIYSILASHASHQKYNICRTF